MSTPNGPSRRRRIAGESKPGAPTPPSRPVVRRPSSPAEESTPAEDLEPGGTSADPSPTPVEDSTAVAPVATPGRTGGTEPVADTDTEAPSVRPAAPRVGRRPGAAPVAPPVDTDDRADGHEAGSAGASSSAVGTSRRRPPLGRALLVLLAVAAVAFGGFFGFRGLQDVRDVEGLHAEAAESAASAAETIFSYRYDQIEQYLEDSREVMTDSFADDFETISPALSDLAPQRQIQVEATTRDAAAEPCGDDCSRDEVTVLVFVDQARLADGSTTPTVFGNRVEMTMVHQDGRWLVDDVKAL